MNVDSPKAYAIPDVDSMPAEMPPPLPRAPLHLAPVGTTAVDLDVDGGRLSSDAGLVLLNAPDDQCGVTRDLAAGLRDPRAPRRGHFTLHDLLQQRVLHIAAGYEDANDANTLRPAPICTRRLDRLPASGPPLASPPTLARFDNRVSRTELSRMAPVLVDPCIASYAQAPTLIVRDFDDTEDPAHGAQEQVRYDGYDGGDCFLPLHVYEGLSGRLSTTIVKAKRCSGAPMLAGLRRLGKHLRPAGPDPLRIARGDSPVAYPEVLPWRAAQAHLP